MPPRLTPREIATLADNPDPNRRNRRTIAAFLRGRPDLIREAKARLEAEEGWRSGDAVRFTDEGSSEIIGGWEGGE